MRTLIKSLFIVVILANLGCVTESLADDPIVIRMGTVISHREGVFPHHMLRAEAHMARLIEKNTNGEVVVDLLESGEVSIRRMAEMTAEGDVIQGANLNAFFFPKVPELLIQSIPFLFDGAEHARRFATSEPAAWMSAKVEAAYGVKILGYLVVATDVSFSGVEPVKDISDFTDKILNGSRGTDAMFDGVRPKQIEHVGFGDALKGALVDSEIDITVGMLQNNDVQKLYRRFKNTTLVPNYYTIFYTPVINMALWESLSDSQQQGINDAMREVENAAVAYQHDSMMWAYQQAQSKGVAMRMQTDAERAAWKAEFYPPIKKLAISSSSNPEETTKMIEKIEDLTSDLKWR